MSLPGILRKNIVFWLWKPHFCDFAKIKKICHLICKISNNFCLAKYDLRWSWFFDYWVPFWNKCKNQALKKVIKSKKVFSKSCWKFYILGGEFFLFWRNCKNVTSRAEKPCFLAIFCHFRPFSGQNRVFQPCKPHFFDFIKIKKNCHLICKISDIFCLAKYDLRWSWFFDFYYMGVQIFKPAELYQNVL